MLPTYIYNKVYALLLALAIGSMASAAEQQPDTLATVQHSDSLVIVQQPDSLTDVDTVAPQEVSIPLAAESISIDSLAYAAIQSLKPKTFKPEPIRSQWLAMVLPGGGQIYNRKYWKLPILYGGFLGCAYALTWNGQMLRDYSQAYLDITDKDPDTKSYEKMLPIGYDISGREEKFKEIFKNKKNYYRKYRDLSILAFALVYVIGVIDAYVDAELSTFDISPDLTMHMSPAIINTNPRGSQSLNASSNIGLALTLNF